MYGLLLGLYGSGAVAGAMSLGYARIRITNLRTITVCALMTGLLFTGVGLSRDAMLSGVAILAAGVPWMLLVATCNVNVQLAFPGWVMSRVQARLTTAMTGGFAVGAWVWGMVAKRWGADPAIMASGAMLIVSAIVGLRFLLVDRAGPQFDLLRPLPEPERRLRLFKRPNSDRDRLPRNVYPRTRLL